MNPSVSVYNVGGLTILRREPDGFIDLEAMASPEDLDNWSADKEVHRRINDITQQTGYALDEMLDIVPERQPAHLSITGGTWAHFEIAILFGCWLSPAFKNYIAIAEEQVAMLEIIQAAERTLEKFNKLFNEFNERAN